MNPLLDFWIHKSISMVFRAKMKVLEPSLIIFQEGQFRDTNKVSEHLELRVDGPYYQQKSPKIWRLRIEVNVLVVVNIKNDKPEYSVYRINKLTGEVASILDEPFLVTNDAEEKVGCMRKVQSGSRDWTKTSHFGQIEEHIKISQSTVETAYEMEYRTI